LEKFDQQNGQHIKLQQLSYVCFVFHIMLTADWQLRMINCSD